MCFTKLITTHFIAVTFTSVRVHITTVQRKLSSSKFIKWKKYELFLQTNLSINTVNCNTSVNLVAVAVASRMNNVLTWTVETNINTLFESIQSAFIYDT